MLRFDQGDLRFNYRSIGIILHENQVLIHKSPKDNFWALPGGRVEFQEAANQTIKREMLEELGIDVGVERLLWVVESFFDYNGKSYHELGFYFLLSTNSNSVIYTKNQAFDGIEKDNDLIFKWHEIEDLENIEIHPKFLQSALKSLPEAIEYVVHYG